MTSPTFDQSQSANQALPELRKGRPSHLKRLVPAALLLVIIVISAWWVTPLVWKWQARQALAVRDYASTSTILERLEHWFGADGESCFLRARLCRKRGDWNGVHESLIRARDQRYPVDRLEREQWMTLAQSGQLRAAEPHLRKLLTDPRDDGAEICEAFVNGYFVNYRMTDALQMLDAWIADFPNDAQPRLIRGKIRAEQQFLKEAEADLRAARSLDPKSDSIALELADVLVLQRQIESAIKIYQRIPAGRTESVRARLGESKGLRLIGKFEEARTAARRILEVQADHREALLEMGLANLELERYAEAILILRKALELNPRSLVVHQALAGAYRATGDSERAQEHATYVAHAQLALQRADRLSTHVTQHPDDAQARYEIGSIYLQYAVPERGVQWLKSALNCDSNHRAAKEALDRYVANPSASMPMTAMATSTSVKPAHGDEFHTKTQDHVTAIQFRERKFSDSAILSGGRKSVSSSGVSPKSDADFIYRNGEESERSTILEGIGGGAGVFDFDRDDRPDLVLPGGGTFASERSLSPALPALLHNHGEWDLRRCEVAAGLGGPTHYSHGVAIGDYDSDGFPDLMITGYGGLQFFQNQGDGTFVDRTQIAKFDDRLWSTSAAWGDFDGDGNLDLYVAHYVDWSFDHDPYCATVDGKKRERCPPQRYEPLPDAIYRSLGDGRFVNASRECGLRRDGKGLGVVLADLDLDGDLDIYVANDTVGNFLYQNDGRGHFTEIAVAAGAAFNETGSPDGSMGVAVVDYNLDGLPDIWVTNYERETIGLYKNLGNCNFQHSSQSTGVSVVGTMFVGFGAVFIDADRDGDEDAFVANGHVLRFPNNAPVRQLPLVFENVAGKRFVNVAPQAGDYCRTPHIGRGAACGDLDDDGDQDLVISHLNEPMSILENTTPSRGRWLKVRLIGTNSNRDAIGSRMMLRTDHGIQMRQVTSGDSYLSQSDRTAFWGMVEGTVVQSLRIEWPTGRAQSIDYPATNQTLTIREPSE